MIHCQVNDTLWDVKSTLYNLFSIFVTSMHACVILITQIWDEVYSICKYNYVHGHAQWACDRLQGLLYSNVPVKILFLLAVAGWQVVYSWWVYDCSTTWIYAVDYCDLHRRHIKSGRLDTYNTKSPFSVCFSLLGLVVQSVPLVQLLQPYTNDCNNFLLIITS